MRPAFSTPHIKSHFHHPLISAKSFLTLGFMGIPTEREKKSLISFYVILARTKKGRSGDDKQHTNVFESTFGCARVYPCDSDKLYRIILPHTFLAK
jgi:hypothetical protein